MIETLNDIHQTSMILSKEDFNYKQLLEAIKTAKYVFVTTYSLDARSEVLANLEANREADNVTLISNIPARSNSYPSYARDKAGMQISNALKQLAPERFVKNTHVFFNFANHSKIIALDDHAYIGSANISGYSRKNYEAGVLINHKNIARIITDTCLRMMSNDLIPYIDKDMTEIEARMQLVYKMMEDRYDDLESMFYTIWDDDHRGEILAYRVEAPHLIERQIKYFCDIKEELSELAEIMKGKARLIEFARKIDAIDEAKVVSAFEQMNKLKKLSEHDPDKWVHDQIQTNLLGDEDTIHDQIADWVSEEDSVRNDLADEAREEADELLKIGKEILEAYGEIVREFKGVSKADERIDNT